jgi:hypothetical protein
MEVEQVESAVLTLLAVLVVNQLLLIIFIFNQQDCTLQVAQRA